jgi:peroxiredoxin
MKIVACLLLLPVLWTLQAMADPVSEFSLPALDGKEYRLGEYAGKWVVINYWSTTCAPCLQEIPELEAFHKRHHEKDAVVLGVNYEDIKKSWLQDFVESMKISYPVLLSDADARTPFGPIMMLPTTYIISPEGKFMGRQSGAITAGMLDKYLESHSKSTGRTAATP